jgi:hypothetical protein
LGRKEVRSGTKLVVDEKSIFEKEKELGILRGK